MRFAETSFRSLAGAAVSLLLGACATVAPQSPPAPASGNEARPLAPAMRAALQGDMAGALDTLRSVPEAGLSPREAEMRQCVLARFAEGGRMTDAPGLPPVAMAVMEAYRRYWRGMMLRRTSAAQGEAALLAELNALQDPSLPYDRADLAAATDAARTLLEKSGLHALTGKTPPYYELMVWRRETPTDYDVTLPERTVRVTVVFMNDFVLKGWLGYATCERIGTGGWATHEKLFAVAESYDLGSESFKVSYLTHEGQHFADYQDFPKLESPELEYRAKLAELAQSTATTRELFRGFTEGSVAGRGVPHSHAEYWIGKSMKEKGVDSQSSDEKIRDAAVGFLRESSADMRKAGAQTVERFLAEK